MKIRLGVIFAPAISQLRMVAGIKLKSMKIVQPIFEIVLFNLEIQKLVIGQQVFSMNMQNDKKITSFWNCKFIVDRCYQLRIGNGCERSNNGLSYNQRKPFDSIDDVYKSDGQKCFRPFHVWMQPIKVPCYYRKRFPANGDGTNQIWNWRGFPYLCFDWCIKP